MAAARAPDDPALDDGGAQRTYAELSTRVWKLAAGLEDLGMRPGDRLAGWLPRGDDELTALLATSAAGGVYVPLHAELRAHQVRHVLADCGAGMVVTRGDRLEALARIAPELPDLRCVLGAGRSDTQILRHAQAAMPVVSMSEVRASSDPADPRSRRSGADTALLLYPGAGSGPPVAAPLTHGDVVARAARRVRRLHLDRDDRVVSHPDLSVRPGVDLTTGAWAAGACVIADPPDALEDLLLPGEAEGVTVLSADWSTWAHILSITWGASALPDLRRAVVCGGRPSRGHTAELEWRLPGVSGHGVARPAYDRGVIVVGGHPVGPSDIVDRFMATGVLSEVRVDSVLDPVTGRRPRVVCTLRHLDGAEAAVDADALRRMVERDLPPFMMPRDIEVRSS